MASGTITDYDVATSTTNTYTLDYDLVTVAYNVNVTAEPYANGSSVAEAQTQTFNNPTYALQGVIITERSGSVTYDKLREWATRQYNSSEKYLTLKIDYGDTSSTLLTDSSGATEGIRVVLKSFNASIGKDRYIDTNKVAGIASVTFIESA